MGSVSLNSKLNRAGVLARYAINTRRAAPDSCAYLAGADWSCRECWREARASDPTASETSLAEDVACWDSGIQGSRTERGGVGVVDGGGVGGGGGGHS